MKGKFILLLSFFIGLVNIVLGHGVEYSIIKGGIGIEVFYSDKTPMNYSEIKIFSPDDKETPFQQGFTDKNGRFFFCPDKKGQWKIEVNDGMGHGLVEEIEIYEDFDFVQKQKISLPLWQKILTGVSIIFGFTGILFYLKAKKKG